MILMGFSPLGIMPWRCVQASCRKSCYFHFTLLHDLGVSIWELSNLSVIIINQFLSFIKTHWSNNPLDFKCSGLIIRHSPWRSSYIAVNQREGHLIPMSLKSQWRLSVTPGVRKVAQFILCVRWEGTLEPKHPCSRMMRKTNDSSCFLEWWNTAFKIGISRTSFAVFIFRS